jgi:hypothetical protein
MRKKISILLLVFSILTIFPVVSVTAKNPLYGDMDLKLLLEPHETNSAWTITWVGTITFEEKGPFDMRFILIGTGIPREGPTGKATHFGEIWEIYVGTPDDMILWGYDKGVTNQKKDTLDWPYRMNGKAEEATFGWEKYSGRNVYMSGTISWLGAPFTKGSTAPGIFRIN